MSQYNQQQPIYVSSNSNQNINQQQQQQLLNTSAQNLYLNGPIYVSSNVAPVPGIPNSASNNSVLSSQQSTVPNVPIPPPTPIYVQTNGIVNTNGNGNVTFHSIHNCKRIPIFNNVSVFDLLHPFVAAPPPPPPPTPIYGQTNGISNGNSNGKVTFLRFPFPMQYSDNTRSRHRIQLVPYVMPN